MGRKAVFVDLHPFPGYQVSPDGRVRSGKHVLTNYFYPDGTRYVHLKVLGRRIEYPVNILVAVGFLGMPPGHGYRVAHRNGDRGDCVASNLVWVVDGEWHFRYYRELMRVPDWYMPGLRQR